MSAGTLASVDRLARRIAAEYHEMPCLSLTLEQAERLFGVPSEVCRLVLDRLVTAQILTHKDGRYTRGPRTP